MNAIELDDPRSVPREIRQSVERLLIEVDEDFLPPLSARTSALTSKLQEAQREPGIPGYLNALSDTIWLLAMESESVIGLLSYIPHHYNPDLPLYSPSAYVTTVAVLPRARRAGIAAGLYLRLERAAIGQELSYITTRTWATNAAHIALLLQHGFKVVLRIPDDRETEIDTLYFARRTAYSLGAGQQEK